MKQCLLTVLCVLACGVCASAQVEGPDSARDVLEGIKQARLQIPEGRVVLESAMQQLISGVLRPYSRSDYTCFFRGNELRMDRRIRRVASQGEEGEVLTEVNILTSDGDYLHRETPPSGERITGSITHTNAGEQIGKNSRIRVWDVRLLGLLAAPFPIHHSVGWEEALALSSATDVSFGDVENSIKVSYPHGVKTIILDPQKGNQPVRIEFHGTDTQIVVDIILKNWTSVASHEVWFPELVTLTQSNSDGVVTLINECHVTETDFLHPLPADTFSMRGLGLEPGHIMREIGSSPQPSKQWDGDELIPYQAPSLPVTESHASKWLILNAVLMGIAGLLFLWIRHRSLRAP